MSPVNRRHAAGPGVVAALVAVLVSGLVLAGGAAAAAETVVVGSKNFEENRLLAEIFAQLLEARTELTVVRRLNLAGTQVCFEAITTGAIDVYPEYSGTALAILLEEPPRPGEDAEARTTRNRVRRELLRRHDLAWLAPLGFENAYAVAVAGEVARRHGLRSLSDLVPLAGELDAAFGYEFLEREDGLPGLARRYGLEFASVTPMQQTLKYQSVEAGRLDVLDVYTTDGRLATHDLVVLTDDKGFFPVYEAAALVRGETLRRLPQVGAVLSLLAGAFDEATLRRLNLRLQEGGEEPAVVARDALEELGLVAPSEEGREVTTDRRTGTLAFAWRRRGELARRTGEHLTLSALALLAGVLTAVPLGVLLERRQRLAEPLIRAVGLTQTIPSLALLAFMIPLLGVGEVPALAALWLYSLFPILRNTYSGVRDADPRAAASALALGATPAQVLRWVRLPLAAPVIMAGVRTAAVITIGTATLAAFIGAGGLGEPIITGLQLADTRRILSGAIPAALLALVVDRLLAWLEERLRPPGLTARATAPARQS